MTKILFFILIGWVNLFGHDVFDPESRPIPRKQIYNLPVKKIYFYIHFISARYGKKFNNIEIQKEFEKQEWYKVNKNYHDSLLNDIDKQNIKNITVIYDSLTKHIKQLKELKSQIVWEKPVRFIEKDTTQKCIFTVTKQKKGFKVNLQFQNKYGIYYKDEYSVLFSDFGNESNGYPYDGAYEAIASNFEFINIEFFPDARTEQSMIWWYEKNRKMTAKQAKKKFEQFERRILDFKGETFFSGSKDDTVFPKEFIYLTDEKSFVLVYSP